MTDRSIVRDFALPKRGFLGPTSMDAEMAFHMCNQAQVCQIIKHILFLLIGCMDCL